DPVVERALRAEVIRDRPEIRAGRGRDRTDRRAVVAPPREELPPGPQQRRHGRLPLVLASHASSPSYVRMNTISAGATVRKGEGTRAAGVQAGLVGGTCPSLAGVFFAARVFQALLLRSGWPFPLSDRRVFGPGRRAFAPSPVTGPGPDLSRSSSGEALQSPRWSWKRRRMAARKKFGTFAGVFTPSIMTILGVIL